MTMIFNFCDNETSQEYCLSFHGMPSMNFLTEEGVKKFGKRFMRFSLTSCVSK